jgi:hypothetical protein
MQDNDVADISKLNGTIMTYLNQKILQLDLF